MNYNDQFGTYKNTFGFKPEKITSEEAARTNAEIESQQKSKTDAALAALLAGSRQKTEEDEAAEFKPFSFEDAPVFKSIEQNDDSENKENQQNANQQNDDKEKAFLDEPPEEEDFWHQRDAMLDKTKQNNSLNLPSLTPPPPKPQMPKENENHEIKDSSERLAAFADDRPAVKDATSPDYKPVPYVPQEPVSPETSEAADGKDSDFRSSPEFQAFLKDIRAKNENSSHVKAEESGQINQKTNDQPVQPQPVPYQPEYANQQASPQQTFQQNRQFEQNPGQNQQSVQPKPVPYQPQYANQQASPQQTFQQNRQFEQNPSQNQQSVQPQPVPYQPQYANQQPAPQQTQYYNQQSMPQSEAPKKKGFFAQLFGTKPPAQNIQNPVQPQYGMTQNYQGQQFSQPPVQQYNSAPAFQNQSMPSEPPKAPAQSLSPELKSYATGMRAQAYATEKSKTEKPAPVPQTQRRAVDAKNLNASPVREFVAPPEENQFDFAAFAARTGRTAFQPKKFEAQPLQNLYGKSDSRQGFAMTSGSSSKPAAVQRINKPNDTKDNILYKIPSKDSACRRVAKFLLLIGVDEAAKVIALLPSDLVDKIIPEVASVRRVDPDEAEQIIAEFADLYEQAKEGGGVGTARTILEKAFGEARAQELMQKAVPFEGGKPFEYLKDLDGEQMFTILKDESAPVRALVLSQVKPAVAAAVINQMDDEERKETVRRLAKLTNFPPDILGRIDKTMREKAESLKTPRHNTIDGRGALANILRKMDSGAEKNILSNLSLVDTELESDLRKRLFTLDDVINADDRYLQKKLHSMSDVDIAVLICGKESEFRKKILSNISKSRGAIVLDEEDARKPIRKRDSDEMTNNFVNSLRAAWECGDLVIGERDEEEWVQ